MSGYAKRRYQRQTMRDAGYTGSHDSAHAVVERSNTEQADELFDALEEDPLHASDLSRPARGVARAEVHPEDDVDTDFGGRAYPMEAAFEQRRMELDRRLNAEVDGRVSAGATKIAELEGGWEAEQAMHDARSRAQDLHFELWASPSPDAYEFQCAYMAEEEQLRHDADDASMHREHAANAEIPSTAHEAEDAQAGAYFGEVLSRRDLREARRAAMERLLTEYRQALDDYIGAAEARMERGLAEVQRQIDAAISLAAAEGQGEVDTRAGGSIADRIASLSAGSAPSRRPAHDLQVLTETQQVHRLQERFGN